MLQGCMTHHLPVAVAGEPGPVRGQLGREVRGAVQNVLERDGVVLSQRVH